MTPLKGEGSKVIEADLCDRQNANNSPGIIYKERFLAADLPVAAEGLRDDGDIHIALC